MLLVILDVSVPTLDEHRCGTPCQGSGVQCEDSLHQCVYGSELNYGLLSDRRRRVRIEMRMATDLIHAITEVLAGRRFVSPDL